MLAVALLAAGCASPPAPPPPPPPPVEVPAPPPAPAPVSTPDTNASSGVVFALQHADRVRGLPASDLVQEIARLSAAPQTALVQVQLALTLMQTRSALDGVRAGQVLQRVLTLDVAEARALHPLCRHLVAQLADQKRLEDQIERQAQQLREAQRRADQLADRLDALRAIERARPRLP